MADRRIFLSLPRISSLTHVKTFMQVVILALDGWSRGDVRYIYSCYNRAGVSPLCTYFPCITQPSLIRYTHYFAPLDTIPTPFASGSPAYRVFQAKMQALGASAPVRMPPRSTQYLGPPAVESCTDPNTIR